MVSNGFSLIEVLVALFVLAFGLLGTSALELSAMRESYDAYLRSLTVVRVRSLSERLRAAAPSRWQNEVKEWNAINARLLPGGKGDFSCEGGGAASCVIQLCWRGHAKVKTCLHGKGH